jgi:hypothetical protein
MLRSVIGLQLGLVLGLFRRSRAGGGSLRGRRVWGRAASGLGTGSLILQRVRGWKIGHFFLVTQSQLCSRLESVCCVETVVGNND